MLQSTINSWSFFLDNASGDCLSHLAQSLDCHSYSPSDILNKLFKDNGDGTELSYDSFLYTNCRNLLSNVDYSPSVEQMEDTILVDLIYSTIKRCPEDEKDLLLDLLGLNGSIDKDAIVKELSIRAASMDRYLLPGIALLIVAPQYYRRIDFMHWPFHLSSKQVKSLYSVRNHISYGDDTLTLIIIIAFHRSIVYSPESTKTAKLEPQNKVSRCVGRPKETWLSDVYRSKYATGQVENILSKEHIWQKIVEWTKKVQYSEKAGRDAYKSLAAAIIYYALQRTGIAKNNSKKLIPLSFANTALLLGKDVAEDLAKTKGAGPLSRSSISPYWFAMSKLFEKMYAIHVNNSWEDKRDIMQTAMLIGIGPQGKPFFVRQNIDWIGGAVNYLLEKLPKII